MLPRIDYHTHPLAHDPHRRYTDDLLNQWADAAINVGLNQVVFTDHDSFHKGVDFDAVERVQGRYSHRLTILMGVELDNDPASSLDGRRWTEANYNRFDYILGSIHFIDQWPFDHPDYIEHYKKYNIADLYEKYFKEIARIASDGIYDGYAHLDLIKIFNFFPDRDVFAVVDEALDQIAKFDRVMEINTAGWHKPVKEQYPHMDILKRAVEKGIRLTVSSDAHASSHLGRDFDKLSGILVELGVNELATFSRHRRKMVPLS